ncbi:SDR family NAD(P)-dependent oxidoreductase [Rhodococcus sp. 14-1411-2a]|uniref:SDR family NAD(P)-dependent oxidoreductase n=1 Tax=Rhodococcus sp. 14-1411-2a TaxID=2023151 RepID=UPI000B9B37C3|nr:SDR family oxidoreductase [Rhodococcus sp. 14-1411-2a]OZF52686.1 short-chain dehydrogenase [Rhodococcus sp. 14-1411-2a]
MTDSLNLDGLNAVVTGGASGIGAAVVRLLSSRGAKVSVLDLETGNVDEHHHAFRCDVSDDVSVRSAIEATARELGGIDIVVNNAGIGVQGTVGDNSDDEWTKVLDVNVIGLVRVSRAAMPFLKQSDHASIVNICSIAATAGLPMRAAYSASKGAVLSLTQAMAADNVRTGIRVNCVNPGTVDTPWVQRLLDTSDDPDGERTGLQQRQPHGRLVTANEVAHAVAYLASPSASSTTGTSLAVDGGMQAVRVRP